MTATRRTISSASDFRSRSSETRARGRKLLRIALQVASILVGVTLLNAPLLLAQEAHHEKNSLDQIRSYISAGWDTLTRSMSDCNTVADTKLASISVLYLPADFTEPAAVKQTETQCKIQVQHLPSVIHHIGEIEATAIDPAGLLYLQNRYVVPGGRFNEMYGWDSYFIIRGLVRDGRSDLARGMVENFFFEIEHYGGVLNANRTYYLSRSQP